MPRLFMSCGSPAHHVAQPGKGAARCCMEMLPGTLAPGGRPSEALRPERPFPRARAHRVPNQVHACAMRQGFTVGNRQISHSWSTWLRLYAAFRDTIQGGKSDYPGLNRPGVAYTGGQVSHALDP